jgi:hypothetical protein
MSVIESPLSRLKIASPCPASWADMHGDARVRFCEQCKLRVYNISEMTHEDAERLLLEREGRLCVRYYQRADGTVLTRDCPVGMERLRKATARLLRRSGAVLAMAFGGLAAISFGSQTSRTIRLRLFEPFATVAAWLDPPNRFVTLTGAVAFVPPPPARPTPRELAQLRTAIREQNLKHPDECVRVSGSTVNEDDLGALDVRSLEVLLKRFDIR